MTSPASFRTVRLTKQAKALLWGLSVLMLAVWAAPFAVKLFPPAAKADFIETNMPCDSSFWPEGMAHVMVTISIDGGTTMSRPAVVQPARTDTVYFCTIGGRQ